jgi:hypothetical protein
MEKENAGVVADRFWVAGSFCLLFVLVVAWLCCGCGAPTAAAPTRVSEPQKSIEQSVEQPRQSEAESVDRAFSTWQVIGEGSRFLTVKIDLARERDHGAEISALVLDRDQAPLRHVTGYAFRPDIPARDHLWFFFLVYAPRDIPEQMRQSKFIRFCFENTAGVKVEKSVAYDKTWQTEDEAKIFDLPAPPAEVEGFLVLKDYAFLARGDLRKPDGYYVEGKIIGDRGSYTRFEVMSEIKGKEPKPEISLDAQRGWLELSTGATRAMQEAVAPVSPYVNGWWDGKGYFHPDPPVVY